MVRGLWVVGMGVEAALCLLVTYLFSTYGAVRCVKVRACGPTRVAFPGGISGILVIGGTIPRPSSINCACGLCKAIRSATHTRTSDTLCSTYRSLNGSVISISFFGSILLCRSNAHRSAGCLISRGLAPRAIGRLYQRAKASTIVSLSHLLFQVRGSIITFTRNFIIKKISVRVAKIIHNCLPKQSGPLTAICIRSDIF